MSFHQRDDIRWNKKGYLERFDGKKYWRKLCVVDGCLKRAKVVNWCKRHFTEQKQKSLNSTGPTEIIQQETNRFHLENFQTISQIPISTSSNFSSSLTREFHLRNEIRLNKRGFREQYDGIGHWRPLCKFEQCSKRAKKFSFCKRHFTEQIGKKS